VQKLESQHLLTAAFIIFVVGLIFTVFVPNVTATATLQQESNVPLVVGWAVPVIMIVALAMFYSYKAICASDASKR